jgi:hypothetical protein
MQRLRERYCRSLTKAGAEAPYAAPTGGPYAGNTQPYGNPDISEIGYKYWKEGTYDYAAPTTEDYNWYNNVVRHGLLKPYVLFDLETPRPGWWQYMGQLILRFEVSPQTTFFVHPNGSWAFFNQSFIYNGNGLHLVPIGTTGIGVSEWDAANMEHCIFDKVHFSVWSNQGTATTISTTFRDLYNQAIANGIEDKTLTDNSQPISLSDMRATFTAGTIVDPYDADVTYAQMQVNWPPSFTAFYRELAYFSGTKIAANSFDAHLLGGALDLSMGALWKSDDVEGATLIYPDQLNTPATFSTCVMITK